jgi:hypothetical protein
VNTTPDRLRSALTDVRKAYRLVYAYQRRLWDLLRTLDDVLRKGGLEFHRWSPVRFWPPPKASTPFFADRSPWDFLPAYKLQCEWQGRDADAHTTRRVSIVATADTGGEGRSAADPDPSSFDRADDTRTDLWVDLWTASTASPNWDAAERRVDSGKSDVGEREPFTFALGRGSYTYRCLGVVDVADLVGKEAVREKVLGPIEDWLAS